MGALLSEDHEDYKNRIKYKQQQKENSKQQANAPRQENGNGHLPQDSTVHPQGYHIYPEDSTVYSQNSSNYPPSFLDIAEMQIVEELGRTSINQPTTSGQPPLPSSSFPSSANQPYSSGQPPHSSSHHSKAPNSVSSIFSCESHNPGTDDEMQINPDRPNQPVQPQVSHFHPPILIIDSRREDEYKESHIHGVCQTGRKEVRRKGEDRV